MVAGRDFSPPSNMTRISTRKWICIYCVKQKLQEISRLFISKATVYILSGFFSHAQPCWIRSKLCKMTILQSLSSSLQSAHSQYSSGVLIWQYAPGSFAPSANLLPRWESLSVLYAARHFSTALIKAGLLGIMFVAVTDCWGCCLSICFVHLHVLPPGASFLWAAAEDGFESSTQTLYPRRVALSPKSENLQD